MLQIRQAQIDVMRASMRRNYEEKLIKHLSSAFPEEIKKLQGPPGKLSALRQFIDEGIKEAEKFGLQRERNVTLFIDLMMGLSPDFLRQREHGWIVGLLTKVDLNETEKMDVIYKRLQAREEAVEKKKT